MKTVVVLFLLMTSGEHRDVHKFGNMADCTAASALMNEYLPKIKAAVLTARGMTKEQTDKIIRYACVDGVLDEK